MIPQIMHLPYLLLPSSAAFVLLSLWLIRGKRSRSPRCPKCWYDMSGSALTCPECGHTAPNQAALHRPRRRKKLAALALLIALASAAAALPRLPRTIYYALMPTWHATQSVSLPGYEVRILEHTDAERFGRAVEITDSRGQTLFHMEGMYFTIGDTHNAAAKPIGIGEDITGDGIPDLIITHNTGGSGCQETYYLFQLGKAAQPDFAPLATLDFCGYFEDKDHDGVPEFIASDRTFAYRWTSGAASPHPEVILRWHKDQHRYVVAPDLMLRAPNTAELDALRLKLTSDPKILNEERRSRSLATALDLIYSGNRAQGLQFLEATWPERGILSTFLLEFQRALDESPFAAEVRDLQTLPSSAPSNKP